MLGPSLRRCCGSPLTTLLFMCAQNGQPADARHLAGPPHPARHARRRPNGGRAGQRRGPAAARRHHGLPRDAGAVPGSDCLLSRTSSHCSVSRLTTVFSCFSAVGCRGRLADTESTGLKKRSAAFLGPTSHVGQLLHQLCILVYCQKYARSW